MTGGRNTTEAVDRDPVHGLFLLIALLAVACSGCAGKSFSDLRPGIESRGHYIEGVPFFRQDEYDCGPAALAVVLSFWGRSVDLEEIRGRVLTPKLRGTLPMDLERYAREAGFTAESSAGAASLEMIKTPVRNSIPVICLLDLGFGPYKQPHYVTVIGFDDGNTIFITHDGVKQDRLMSYETFERAWSRAGRWMLVVRP
jgi:ABC-type bacteriocin/lantibiotic exporter with double-glycine peptidase domain